MRRAALICLILSLASPAWADLVMDSNYSGNMLIWRAKTRMHEQIRDDRSRVETWSTETFDVTEQTKHTIDIVRADRHLRWRLEPDSMTYREYPWPDTIETEAPDSDELRARAMADSLEKTRELPRRTGEQQTINGLPTERFYLRIEPDSSKTSAVGRGASELEIWSLVDKHNKEIHRLQEVATRHALLSQPRSMADPTQSLADPWAGVESVVPIRATFKVAMLDSAQLKEMKDELQKIPPDSLKAAKAAMPEMYKDIDFDTGQMTLFRIEVTAVHLGPVPDDAFEVPSDYKKLATTPRAHSPR